MKCMNEHLYCNYACISTSIVQCMFHMFQFHHQYMGLDGSELSQFCHAYCLQSRRHSLLLLEKQVSQNRFGFITGFYGSKDLQRNEFPIWVIDQLVNGPVTRAVLLEKQVWLHNKFSKGAWVCR